MYESPWSKEAYPRVQVLTVEQLLADPHKPNPACLQVPGGPSQHTFQEAPKHRRLRHRQEDMLGE